MTAMSSCNISRNVYYMSERHLELFLIPYNGYQICGKKLEIHESLYIMLTYFFKIIFIVF